MSEQPKPVVIEEVASLAMRLGKADCDATRSGPDLTQWQLMTCLILRAYLKTFGPQTHRGDPARTKKAARQIMAIPYCDIFPLWGL